MANSEPKASGKSSLNQILKPGGNNALSQAQAQKFVDKLDQNLNENSDEAKISRHLVMLMKFCREYAIVPTSHVIADADLETLGPLEDDPSSYLSVGLYRKQQEVLITVLPQTGVEDMKKIKGRLCRQVVVWKRISHPNISPFIGITLTNGIAVVSEWADNGSILKYLRDPPDDHEPNPVELLYESILGLKHLHEKGIIHGDLRAVRILVTEGGQARLADPGLAKAALENGNLGVSAAGQASVISGGGNTRYLPPEYFSDQTSTLVTKKGDVYTMGMTIYEVLTDKKPFHDYTPYSIGKAIIDGKRPKKPDFIITRGYTNELWKLTEDCWDVDPEKRITVDELAVKFEGEVSKWKPRKK